MEVNNRVLIVKDSITQASILKSHLEDVELEVDIVTSHKSCMASMVRRSYNIIIINLSSSKNASINLIKELKKNGASIPVIVVSDIIDKGHVIATLKAGAIDYIRKPYHLEELQVRITHHLKCYTDKAKAENLNLDLKLQTEQLDWIVKQKTMELDYYLKAIDANIASIMTDTEGNIIKVNGLFEEISRLALKDIIGQNLQSLISGYEANFFEEVKSTLKNKNIWRGEIKSRLSKNKLCWFDAFINPIVSDKGSVDYFLILALPITERVLAEKKREHMLKMLEMIAFKTSHNVRGPLARLQGVMNLLRHDLIALDEVQMIGKKLRESADELDNATSGLTTFINNYYQSFTQKEKFTASV